MTPDGEPPRGLCTRLTAVPVLWGIPGDDLAGERRETRRYPAESNSLTCDAETGIA